MVSKGFSCSIVRTFEENSCLGNHRSCAHVCDVSDMLITHLSQLCPSTFGLQWQRPSRGEQSSTVPLGSHSQGLQTTRYVKMKSMNPLHLTDMCILSNMDIFLGPWTWVSLWMCFCHHYSHSKSTSVLHQSRIIKTKMLNIVHNLSKNVKAV